MQAVNIDFTIHVVNGASGEIGLYPYGEIRVLILRGQPESVGVEVINAGQHVERGYGSGGVETPVESH